MSMRHITIKLRGQEPRPHRCHADAALFTCPFCSTEVCKPRQYHQIMAHIAGHKLRAVEYGDQVIYSCNIGCGKTARHFHCCQCPKTYINKGSLKKHLSNSHPIATCTLKPQSVSDPQQEPPSQKPASQPPQEPSSQKPASQPQQEASSQKPASQPQQEPSSQKPASQPQQDPSSQQPASQPKQEPSSQKPASQPPQEPPSQKPASQPQQDPSSQQPASQPQQEPSSQQPASQQPQEPPSQQPASDPQQELPSQQAASHPLQLAAPPAIKRISLQCRRRHITIKLRGQEPRPHRCHADAALFTCPFCSTDVCKPRQYHQIMAHIAGHKLRAVEYGDDVIYSCNIGCGKMARHFHCCQCPKTYINKSALKKHLSNSHPIATCTLKQPASDPLQEPPYQKPPSLPQKESPSQQPASQPQQDPPSQQPASQPQQEPPSQKPASLPQKESPSQQPASQPQQDPPSQQPASQPQQEPPSQKPASLPQKESPSQQPASQPQQEPPSQQPASQPQQDPPSQQPASHPQQDPPSQQPASDPLQLAAPPAIKSHRRHITIKLRGQEPRPHRCHADAALFTCPFCSTDVCKPRQYHQIMAHIAGHKLRAVEYGDDVIYSCNSCGEKARHFHCCQCPQTYFNQGALKRHLCNTHPIATCAPEPQPVGRPLQEPPLQQPAPRPLELAAQRVIVKRKQISVQCPHCRVNLNSKNLKMHIKRKHHEAMHPVTPTWDSSHKVICDIDICKSCVETAPRSELLVTQCVSLSSVDYSCAAEPSEDLSEDMLTEME
ncbi:uncharacterized protein si:ch73-341k19.1 isoform X3 [Ctenopharyngodon idella]|uniref:uncharacterized protein si:ch73-341k19.1 isoform X3 n=1 Tax=Ctenopharyngodon idella TaxID=7959 RepID=UPI0022318313|nr:uncharacterized protein si:ch73-341k19.1 isoform X3 [Ctenopharyngodon idella]